MWRVVRRQPPSSSRHKWGWRWRVRRQPPSRWLWRVRRPPILFCFCFVISWYSKQRLAPKTKATPPDAPRGCPRAQRSAWSSDPYDPDDTLAGPSGSEEHQRYTLAFHPSTDSGRSVASYIPPCKGNGSHRQRPTSPCKGTGVAEIFFLFTALANLGGMAPERRSAHRRFLAQASTLYSKRGRSGYIRRRSLQLLPLCL